MAVEIRKALVLVMSAWFIFASIGRVSGAAPDFNQNYYAPRDRGILGSAEYNHMQRAIDQMAAETKRGEFSPQGAIGDFKYILDYFPNHPRALALASDLSIRAHHPEWVKPYFDRSLALYPDHAATHLIYGTFLQKLGKTSDAIGQYDQALALDAESPTAHYNLGLAYVELRQYDRANYHAQIAYKAGAPLPGLRDKLKQVHAWKPPEDSAASLSPQSN